MEKHEKAHKELVNIAFNASSKGLSLAMNMLESIADGKASISRDEKGQLVFRPVVSVPINHLQEKHIDEILQENPELRYAVGVLIEGCRNSGARGAFALEEYDQVRFTNRVGVLTRRKSKRRNDVESYRL